MTELTTSGIKNKINVYSTFIFLLSTVLNYELIHIEHNS